MALTSIKTDNEKLEIINQLLLPHSIQYETIETIQQAHEAIKTMKIRGAPAIASLAALSFSDQLQKGLDTKPSPEWLHTNESLKNKVITDLKYLDTARPTAVNLGAATRRLTSLLNALVDSSTPTEEIVKQLIKEGRKVADEDFGRNKEMSKHGGEWLVSQYPMNEKLNVLTVCNTGSLATSGYGTALGLITYLHETGRLGRAYFTQTTPYHQGSRLTAMELQSMGIPSMMICDTMVGSLFSHPNPEHKIHAVAVGADRVVLNGDTANKIGTYQAAVLAQRHGIPFIVVAPISTIDLDVEHGNGIPIEMRPSIEACTVRGALYSDKGEKEQVVVMITPKLEGSCIEVYNPSFDVTPAELISAIVTEKGVAIKNQDGKFDFNNSGIV